MYLPVPVNFVFIGFEGNGNQGIWRCTLLLGINSIILLFEQGGFYLLLSPIFCFADFKLNPEEMERWFTKIDHIFEHTRIPRIGEILTPFYKINIDREQRHHLPLVSHINYKYCSQ